MAAGKRRPSRREKDCCHARSAELLRKPDFRIAPQHFGRLRRQRLQMTEVQLAAMLRQRRCSLVAECFQSGKVEPSLMLRQCESGSKRESANVQIEPATMLRKRGGRLVGEGCLIF